MWTKLNKIAASAQGIKYNRESVERIIISSLNHNSYTGHLSFLASGASNYSFVLRRKDSCSVIRVFSPIGNSIQESQIEANILNQCFNFLEATSLFRIKDSNIGALIMPKLEKITPSPDEVLVLQRHFQQILSTDSFMAYVPQNRTITALLDSAELAANSLQQGGQLLSTTTNKCQKLFAVLRGGLTSYEAVMCHGDLSPANILSDNTGRLVAIDWEDRIVGIPDYDYLYWLTFFANRHELNREQIQKAELPFELSVGLITMIIILKEFAHYSSGKTDSGRSFSPEQRISSFFLSLQ